MRAFILALIMSVMIGCATYNEPCPPGMKDIGDENGMCTRVEIWYPAVGPVSQAVAALEVIHILVHDESKTGKLNK